MGQEPAPQAERFSAEKEILDVRFKIGWDDQYQDYVIYFPQINLEEGAQKGVSDQVCRLTSNRKAAEKIFNYTVNLASQGYDVYQLFKKVEAYAETLPREETTVDQRISKDLDDIQILMGKIERNERTVDAVKDPFLYIIGGLSARVLDKLDPDALEDNGGDAGEVQKLADEYVKMRDFIEGVKVRIRTARDKQEIAYAVNELVLKISEHPRLRL